MGFWHTGYIEFHEAAGLPDDQKPDLTMRAGPAFRCEICKNSFWSAEELARHRAGAHPRTRPMLFLRHSPALSTLNVVSMPLASEEVSIGHASKVLLDGRDVDSSQLGKLLSGLRRDFCEITLEEGSIKSKFRIKFKIADPGDLKEVDRAFLELTRRGELTTKRIGDFVSYTKRYETAERYIDGLVQYLFGRLAKQQSGGVHIPFEDYRERLNLALDSMRGFDTPLSRIVVGLINFSENVFDGYDLLSRAPRLQSAMQYFSRVLSGPGKRPMGKQVPLSHTASARIPADEATENLIGWVHELLATGQVEDDGLLQKCLQDSRYPADDQVKLSVLLAEHCLLTGKYVAARDHARRYSDHPIFGRWADAVMQAGTKGST